MNFSQSAPSTLSTGLNRRSFLRSAALTAALSPAAAAFLGSGHEAQAALPFPPGAELDLAILNFALNLEYLEGQYYALGVYGKSLRNLGIDTGTGTDNLVVKSNPQVPFATPALKQYATEIANDEIAHIKFLRNAITSLGGTPVAQPEIDLLNSFNAIAMNAGIAATFDPYADETSFYLGGFGLTDVGVTAYNGAAGALTNKAVLASAAGLLAVEAYHDATLRLTIFSAGTAAQTNAQKISDLRDSLDDNGRKDKDQGVVNADGSPNIVPTDENSIAFARSPQQVLNIVYGGYRVASGGFFPAALNGDIK